MASTDVCKCEHYFLGDHEWLKRGGGRQHMTRPETAVERKSPVVKHGGIVDECTRDRLEGLRKPLWSRGGLSRSALWKAL